MDERLEEVGDGAMIRLLAHARKVLHVTSLPQPEQGVLLPPGTVVSPFCRTKDSDSQRLRHDQGSRRRDSDSASSRFTYRTRLATSEGVAPVSACR